MATTYRTYSYRIKDSSCAWLGRMATSVNIVWNFINEMSYEHIVRYGRFLDRFQLRQMTKGMGGDLGISSQTVQSICDEYAMNRARRKKVKLRWRGRRSLGWIPFTSQNLHVDQDKFTLLGFCAHFWKSRDIPGRVKSGNISQDSRGRWYLNLVVEECDTRLCGTGEVGIDPGQTVLATCSDGTTYVGGHFYRRAEASVVKAQRDNKKRRVKAIHAKTANRRRDEAHKVSNELVSKNRLIAVGDVSAKKLAKTRMAKSSLDASWTMLRTFLKYKAIARKGVYVLVNEANTTRTCSVCREIPDSAPKGVKGLALREWVCSCCGSHHKRDLNAALNILRLGRQALGLTVAEESTKRTSIVFPNENLDWTRGARACSLIQ